MAFDLRAILGLAPPQHAAAPPAQHPLPQQHQQTYTPAQQQQMTPVGQPIPHEIMQSFSPQTRALAEVYQQNPQDPRVMHLDPAMFGYRPDNTQAAPHALQHLIHGSLGQQHGQASNFSTPIQGQQNPGYIPMQGSQGVPNMQGSSGHLPQIRF